MKQKSLLSSGKTGATWRHERFCKAKLHISIARAVPLLSRESNSVNTTQAGLLTSDLSAPPSHQTDSGFEADTLPFWQKIVHSGGAVAVSHRASLFSVKRHLNRNVFNCYQVYYITL